MSDEEKPCNMCQGTLWVRSVYRDPCDVCAKVISKADAEVAAAVREIEAEGLCIEKDERWTVRGSPANGFSPVAHGDTLPDALRAYREARR